MTRKYFPGQVKKIINESDLVKRFIIKLPDNLAFSFLAGQFVMLDLPIDSKYSTRSYSIASPPTNDNTFELLISLNMAGLGTPYLFQSVNEGSFLEVSEVLGKFHLPEVIDTDICFICTGTGIAPLRSMLLDIYNKNIPHKNIFMIFGNRYEKDILYRNEMEELQNKIEGFTFIPVLSRDNPGWEGRTGYVHKIYEELFEDKRPALFFISGWREMINDARKRIKAMGYDKNSVRTEFYD
jgi:phenol/toluene 2-monooxygenase (NADH) P5/A5